MRIIDRPRQSGKTTYLKFLTLEKLADLWEACIEGRVLIIVPSPTQANELKSYFNNLSFEGSVDILTVDSSISPLRPFTKAYDLVLVDECFSMNSEDQLSIMGKFGDGIVGVGTYSEPFKRKLFKDYIGD